MQRSERNSAPLHTKGVGGGRQTRDHGSDFQSARIYLSPTHKTLDSSAQIERQGMHTLVATAAIVCLSFGSNVLLSRALGPSGKGVIDLANATTALFSLVLGGSLAAGLTKVVAQHRGVPAVLARPLTIWMTLAVLLTTGWLASAPQLSIRLGLLPAQPGWFWIVYLSIAIMLALALAQIRGALVGLQALIGVNRIEIGVKAATLVMFALLPLLSGAGTKAFALAALAGNAGMTFAFALLLRWRWKPATSGSWHELLQFSMSLHGANVLYYVTQRIDVFFVQAQHGSSEVGIYALAVTLTQILLLASNAFALPLLPSISAQSDPAVATGATSRVVRLYLSLSVIGAIMLAAVMSWALPLVFGVAFAPSLMPMLILLPGVIAFGLTNILISYFFGRGHARYNLALSFSGLIITIVGNMALTPRFGAIGAAITSTIAYTWSGVLALAGLARFGKLTWREIMQPRMSEFREFAGQLRNFRF